MSVDSPVVRRFSCLRIAGIFNSFGFALKRNKITRCAQIILFVRTVYRLRSLQVSVSRSRPKTSTNIRISETSALHANRSDRKRLTTAIGRGVRLVFFSRVTLYFAWNTNVTRGLVGFARRFIRRLSDDK